MPLTLAGLLREHWQSYASAHRSTLSGAHYRAVRRVLACRTPELGGQLYQCQNSNCQKHHYAYHSCNHRNCPQCGSSDQQLWSAKQEAKLLKVPYFLITFTLPAELRQTCLKHPKELYHLLLTCSAQALKDIIATKTKGGLAGFTSVLHTWGRQLQHHPHVHSVVPALAYNPKTNQLIHPQNPHHFLIHFRPLAARFRSLLQSHLQAQHPNIYHPLSAAAKRSLGPKTQWNVQIKHVGRGNTALRYLARYVHRSAFHPKRLLGYDHQDRIKLRWTSSQTGKTSVLHLHPHEFMRRWLQHVLPKGFPRIRHYGFHASAAKKTSQRIRHHLGQSPVEDLQLPEKEPFICIHCGGELAYLRDLPRLTNPTRGPPK